MTTPAAAVPPRSQPRHALGLPAGSVRAILALAVLGLLWLLALGPTLDPKIKQLPAAFIYLQFLMVLILAHYFSAHGNTIGHVVGGRSPLGLPRGSVRFLLLVGYGGLAYFLYRHEPEFEIPPRSDFFLLLALLLTCFFVGHLLTGLVQRMSGGSLPFWFQDVQAWFALMALICLTILVIVETVVNPGQPPEWKIGGKALDLILAALVGFYFGSRS